MSLSSTVDVNKREYFRVPFEQALEAEMSIVRVHEKPVQAGKARVLIENIGPGGLRFLTYLKMSVNPNVLVEFETTVLGQALKLQGTVVWAKAADDGLFEYGIQFVLDKRQASFLFKLFSDLALRLRKNPLVRDCSFTQMDKINYLKILQKQ